MHFVKKQKKDNVKVILGGYGLDEALGGYDILNPNLNLNSAHSNQLIDGSILDNSKLIKKKYKITKNKSKNFIKDNFIHKKQINLLFKSKIPRTLHMIDRFSMCNSVEFRNPYIDSEFVKSCMQIPKKNFFNKKIGKMPVRNILNNNFKDYQFWIEAKKSVQSPQDQWLKKKLIRQWIDGLLKKNFLYESYNFLSKKEINQYWKNFINNEKSLSLPIWQVINLYFLKRLFK